MDAETPAGGESVVREVFAKTVLNRRKFRDPWFLDEYSVNPYGNCDFNCVYCYTHGSKYGVSTREPIAKINAPTLLGRELLKRCKRREYGFIALGSATEPWMHAESKYELTRKCLEVIARYKFPVHCLTKSTLILRDLDLLERINDVAILPEDLRHLEFGLTVTFSISTLEDDLAKIFEPNAPSPEKRLETLQRIRELGLSAGISYIPVLPFISDSDEQLEEMIKVARDFDANYVFVGALTLQGSRKLYYEILERYFPEVIPKMGEVMDENGKPRKEYELKLEKTAKNLCRLLGVKYMIV